MKIRICVTAYSRPEYFQKVLQGLASNPGVENHEIFYFIDRGKKGTPAVQEEHRRLVMQSGLPCTAFVAHQRRMGCSWNIGSAIHTGFSDPTVDAVIMLEDDTMPSKDFLAFMRQALSIHRGRRDVATVTGYSRRFHETRDRGRLYSVGEGEPFGFVEMEKVFCCWGWATWRRFYDERIRRNWARRVYSNGHNLSWDVVMCRTMHKGKIQVKPDMSRTQNIGRHNGAYCPGPKWHDLHQRTEIWMGDGKERPNLVDDEGSIFRVEPEIITGKLARGTAWEG